MTPTQQTRLRALGYTLDLESLMERLPQDIWITKKEGKNFEKKPVSFVFTRHDDKWVATLSTINGKSGEVYILHRIVGKSPKETVAEMILFMEDNKMLEPNI